MDRDLLKRRLIVLTGSAIFAATAPFALTGCEEEEPYEETEEVMEDVGEDTEEVFEDTGEGIEGIEDVGDEVGDGLEDEGIR